MRHTDVYHRNPNIVPPLARAGRSAHLIASEDASNYPIFDLSCGAAVTGLGHSNGVVKDAIRDQISNLAYVHSAQFTAQAIEDAASTIINDCSKFSGGAVSFFSGGAEAIEAAVKMAMQYLTFSNGKVPAVLVGRSHSYHGNSMLTLALGDHPRKNVFHAGFNLRPHVDRIDAFCPHIMQLNNDGENKAYLSGTLQSLERVLQMNYKYNRPCIVVIETVGGTTIGIAPPTVEYLMGVRRLCDSYGAVLIYDEILCANYRTGYMTAWQYYQASAGLDLAPDIFVMGKGITAGYFPMSAVVINEQIKQAGLFDGKVWHSSTNQNHVIGCAALCAAFSQYDKLRSAIKELGDYMQTQCLPQLMESDAIVGAQGVGMLWGVRFLPNKSGLHRKVKDELFKKGYTAYTDGDTIEGKGNMLMFAPPFIVSTYDLDICAQAIAKAATSADDS